MNYIQTVFVILAGVYGLCVGSFLNVVICRLPIGKKMTNERSECPKCHNMIRWYDNIPLVSYIVLRGKCRKCGLPISYRYPLNEALNMVLWLLCAILYRDNLPLAVIYCVCCSIAICVFWIDFDTKIINDRFVIMLAVLGVASCFFDGVKWYSHIIGAVFGFGCFWLVGFFVSKKVGRDALGMGDVKLAFSMGLILGIGKFLLCMFITSFIALAVMTVSLKKSGEDKNTEFPFGPFLTAGLVFCMLLGEKIVGWYLGVLM